MKSFAKLAVAGVLAAAVLAPTITTASAGNNWRWRHYHYRGWDPGPAILGGAVLGLTLGALANPYAYPPPPPPDYYDPPPPPYAGGYAEDEAHMAWCSATYRSYSPESDTWVDYNGVVHECIGP
jgi:hypothetical protein